MKDNRNYSNIIKMLIFFYYSFCYDAVKFVTICKCHLPVHESGTLKYHSLEFYLVNGCTRFKNRFIIKKNQPNIA